MDERKYTVKTVYSAKWVKLQEIEYEDPNKQIRVCKINWNEFYNF